MDEALAFMLRGDVSGTRTEPSSVGTAVFDDVLPGRWDSNALYVARETTAGEVAAELERLDRPQAIVADERLGAALAPELAERGLRVDRHAVMVLRRPPDRSPDTARVAEVGHEALQALRRRQILSYSWGSEETATLLLASKPVIAGRVPTRFFAALEDGEVVSGTDLYVDPPYAQIEDVATAAEHRNRGHASAVVLRAAEEARAAGATFVFLVADDEDWPKEWYGRLGFDAVGRYYKFIRAAS